jgi:hypothetical protein
MSISVGNWPFLCRFCIFWVALKAYLNYFEASEKLAG